MNRPTLKLAPKPKAPAKKAPSARPMAPRPAATKPAAKAPPRPQGPTPRPETAGSRPPRTAPRPRPAPQPLPDTGERLSKRVMQLKSCSRKEAEQYIEGGWVLVNGVVVEEPQHRVDRETVTLDPHATLVALTPVTLILHKPAGHSDGLEEMAVLSPQAPHPRGRKGAPPNARSLLTPANRWSDDASGTRVLKRHFQHLEADVELETGASGLVVFTQDWRTTRKLVEDMGTMEHEFVVEVEGAVDAEALLPVQRALKDPRLDLPHTKVSVGSSSPEKSRLRVAVKGAHPGLIAYLCELGGLKILSMRRIRLGRIALSDLPVGQWRYLATHEKF